MQHSPKASASDARGALARPAWAVTNVGKRGSKHQRNPSIDVDIDIDIETDIDDRYRDI